MPLHHLRELVDISDGIAKVAVHRLLKPVLDAPDLRLLCHEGEFQPLLGELALHKLDAVLADRAAPPNPALRTTSQLLGTSAIAWYAPPLWAEAVCVLDAVLWLGAPADALDEWRSGVPRQAMLRAALFRVLSDRPCNVPRYEALGLA